MMDKKYQDLHYKHNKSNKDVVVFRKIKIRDIRFKENYIEIDFLDLSPQSSLYGAFIKTIIIPKLQEHSLIID